MATENTMFLRSLRTIQTKNGERHIASLTAPAAASMSSTDCRAKNSRALIRAAIALGRMECVKAFSDDDSFMVTSRTGTVTHPKARVVNRFNHLGATGRMHGNPQAIHRAGNTFIRRFVGTPDLDHQVLLTDDLAAGS